MKITILQRDLDAALSVPWSPTTCLIAQAITRATGKTPNSLTSTNGAFDTPAGISAPWFKVIGNNASTAQSRFDEAYQSDGPEAARKAVAPFIGDQFEIEGIGVPEGPALGEEPGAV